MNIKEHVANLNSAGCTILLNAVSMLDSNTTVKEIQELTIARKLGLKKEEEDKQAEEDEALIKKYKGKCIRVVFKKDHVAILNITDAKIDYKWGNDLQIIGEEISQYKGELRIKEIKDEEDTFKKTRISQFFPNESCEEYPIERFNLLKETIQSIVITL